MFAGFTGFGQKFWDGGAGDNRWESPFNWNDDMIPGPMADVILDNSIVPGFYLVEISGIAGTITCGSLKIKPSLANEIRLIIPSTNTQSIAFSTNSPGYSIELSSGGILVNASGAGLGIILSISDSMKILNNGRYIHQTPRGHASILDHLSSSVGTESGVFEFDVPVVSGSYTVSMSNRRFGSLIFSSISNAAQVGYVSSGSNPVLIRGDLTIRSNTSLSVGFDDTILVKKDFIHRGNVFNLSNNGNGTVFSANGNIYSDPGSLITETNNAHPVLMLAGDAFQTLNIRGNLANEIILKIFKNGHAQLLHPLKLPYLLELRRGRIITDSINLLTLSSSCSIAIDSTKIDSSFIDGPMRKEGLVNSYFLFPVGKTNSMRWIELKNANGTFTVYFLKENPSLLTTNMSGLHHISVLEYWRIEGEPGSSASVELSFDNVNSGGVTDMSSLKVAQLSSSLAWVNRGSISTTGSAGGSGSVVSQSLHSFGNGEQYFTLGSISAGENPLPSMRIILGASTVSGIVRLNFSVSSPHLLRELNIQYSSDGIHFRSIKTIQSSDPFYYAFRQPASSEESFCRILGISSSGATFLSNIVRLSVENSKFKIHLREIPRGNILRLQILSNSNCHVKLSLLNSVGQVLVGKSIRIIMGSNFYELQLPQLPLGHYRILAQTPNGTEILSFIR